MPNGMMPPPPPPNYIPGSTYVPPSQVKPPAYDTVDANAMQSAGGAAVANPTLLGQAGYQRWEDGSYSPSPGWPRYPDAPEAAPIYVSNAMYPNDPQYRRFGHPHTFIPGFGGNYDSFNPSQVTRMPFMDISGKVHRTLLEAQMANRYLNMYYSSGSTGEADSNFAVGRTNGTNPGRPPGLISPYFPDYSQ